MFEVGKRIDPEQLAIQGGEREPGGGALVAEQAEGLLQPFPEIAVSIFPGPPLGAVAQPPDAVPAQVDLMPRRGIVAVVAGNRLDMEARELRREACAPTRQRNGLSG
jgi:hypothetical protein